MSRWKVGTFLRLPCLRGTRFHFAFFLIKKKEVFISHCLKDICFGMQELLGDLHFLAVVSDGLSGDDGEFGGEEGRDAATDITPLQGAESMALTQSFATRLGILEPRCDTTEKRKTLWSEEHAWE